MMSKILKLSILAAMACIFAGCGGAVTDNKTTANTNAGNANAKPAAAAPTADALLALDKQANAAYFKGDSAFFQNLMSDKFAMSGGGQKFDKAASVKMIAGVKCDIKDGWTLDEPKMAMIDADTAVLTYKGTFDGTCTENGKTEKVPSPTRSATVYTRSGDKWLAVYHGETKIVDPKNMKPEAKKEAPAPPTKSDGKMASNSNANAAAPAPAAEPNTDAMVAVEKAGWAAWQARDAKKLEDLTTSNLSFVDLFGNYSATKADTIKSWTGGQCDIKSTSITDATGVSLSPTVGFIMFKGSADGTCDKMKIEPVYGTSFYVKEGDAWKLAFGFESPV
jgi:hypothetical protein